MSTWVEETNRFNFLNLDSRSVTEIRFLIGIKILFTVESLILAQDER